MEWKTIKQADNYEVSSTGVVRNKRTNQTIKPFDNNGYDRVGLAGKKYLVHRLVAGAFIDNPNNYETVNHIDFNKRNNNASNLEWLSNADNVRHAVEHKEGRLDYLRESMREIALRNGGKNGLKSRKPVEQYDLDGNFIARYESARDAAKATQSSYKLISAVCRGNRSTTNGFVWKFSESQSTIESTQKCGSE